MIGPMSLTLVFLGRQEGSDCYIMDRKYVRIKFSETTPLCLTSCQQCLCHASQKFSFFPFTFCLLFTGSLKLRLEGTLNVTYFSILPYCSNALNQNSTAAADPASAKIFARQRIPGFLQQLILLLSSCSKEKVFLNIVPKSSSLEIYLFNPRSSSEVTQNKSVLQSMWSHFK